jgi:hypothetical protein
VHFRRILGDLRYDLEGMLGRLGAKWLAYPEKGAPIGDIVKWFEGEVKSLPGTFAALSKNFIALALAGLLRMLL